MKGKRVSTGSPKSGTEVIAKRLLTAAGLDPAKDIQAQRLDLTKTVDGMKDGSIDALFWSGGLPTPGITDLLTTSADQVEFLDITRAAAGAAEDQPGLRGGHDPGRDLQDRRRTCKTIVVPNFLLVRDDLDANVACVLTKALFDRKPQLEQANAAAKEISLDKARKTDPVVLHRGAVTALDTLNAPK